jgi:hypothetical protein
MESLYVRRICVPCSNYRQKTFAFEQFPRAGTEKKTKPRKKGLEIISMQLYTITIINTLNYLYGLLTLNFIVFERFLLLSKDRVPPPLISATRKFMAGTEESPLKISPHPSVF